MKRLLLFSALILATGGSSLLADNPPKQIDLGKLPAQTKMIDNVVVPVPSEVFSALDKFGSPNWHSVLNPAKVDPEGGRPQIALLLGNVIAEGFIAVEAQESGDVKKIGRSVLNLAKAINVQKSVIARTNSISEAADEKNWNRVRSEFDGALQDVKHAMTELNDAQLAQLVSLGGWLRGTDALTELVQKNYTKQSAELLHQPVMVDYFEQQIDQMNPRLAHSKIVQKIRVQLPILKNLIDDKNGNITPEQVAQVHKIVSGLVKMINPKASSK